MPKEKLLVFWAGTEASLAEYELILAKAADLDMKAFVGVEQPEKAGEKLPRLLSIHDGVGVVSIKGPLVNTDSFWNRLFGLTSYNEIRQAMVTASQHPDISRILLDVDSGGGHAAGMLNTAELISTVDKIKPVHSFTEGVAASAAYMLYSAGRKRYASKDSTEGSIGVLAKHIEYSKMLEKEGITPTIFRSGRWKGLGTQLEELSEDAKQMIQERVDQLAGLFTQAVADNLGTTYQVVDSKMGQGREFIGEEARAVGLVDQITTFDKVLAALQKQTQSSASRKQPYGGKNMFTGKKALSAEDLAAAAAAGITLEEAETQAGATETEEAPEQTQTQETQTQETAEGSETQETAEGSEATVESLKAQLAERDQKLASANARIAVLKEDLEAANGKVIDLQVESKSAKKEVETMGESLQPLKDIVARGVNTMTVALGGSTDEGLASLDAKELVSRHESAAKQYMARFKVGRQSAPPAEGEEAPAAKHSNVTRMDQARYSSVRTR